MGLDSVELLYDTEKYFGIEIPPLEAEEIRTVREFAEAVFRQLQLQNNTRCLQQIVFYRLRQALMRQGFERQNIRPQSLISEFLPDREVKATWKKLEKDLGLSLPRLNRADTHPGENLEVWFLGFRVIGPRQPLGADTLAQLTGWIISLNFQELLPIGEISSFEEVELVLMGIINENLGVEIHEIKPHSNLAHDLGMD